MKIIMSEKEFEQVNKKATFHVKNSDLAELNDELSIVLIKNLFTKFISLFGCMLSPSCGFTNCSECEKYIQIKIIPEELKNENCDEDFSF